MPLPKDRESHSVAKVAAELRATNTPSISRSIHFTPKAAVALPLTTSGRDTVWPSTKLKAVTTGPSVI